MLAVIAAAGPPALARAGRAVVILPFAGPRGEDTTERLASGLRGIKRVSAAKYMGASGRLGAEKAAKTLGVTAVIRGAITRLQGRWAVRVVVRTPDGSLVGRQVFPLRGTRVDRTTMRRLTQSVGRMVKAKAARAKSSPKRRRKPVAAAAATPVRRQPAPNPSPAPTDTPKPPPQQRGFDDGSDYGTDTVVVGDDVDDSETARRQRQVRNQGGLGFAVSGGGGGSPRTPPPRTRETASPRASRARHTRSTETTPPKTSPPKDGERRPWQTIIEASAGLALLSRSFEFERASGKPPTYGTPGVIPAIAIDLAVHPMATLGTPGLSNLGIAGRFQRAVGLKSSPPGSGQLVNTILQMYEIGLTYRWNLLDRLVSPGFRFNLDFGQQFFSIDAPAGTTSLLPNITYTYFKPRIAFEWLFVDDSDIRLGLSVGGSFLIVLSAGDIEANSPNAYGDASVLAFDAGAGFRASYRGFFANLSGFYRRFALEFSGCQEACQVAAGATDAYLGGLLTLGYAY